MKKEFCKCCGQLILAKNRGSELCKSCGKNNELTYMKGYRKGIAYAKRLMRKEKLKKQMRG